MNKKVTMIICGDTVPTESNFAEFINADRESLISDTLWEKMKDADFRFFNLEVPLTDKEEPIVKCGPNLIAPAGCVKGLKSFEPSLVGLANNHTLDQDVQGLFSTFDVLWDNGIPFIGAGKNIEEAAKPYIFEK
ncbi:MAG: CapA family protein, partial [Oscillospiraceae bacterium]|nr:CapA family protein [Oscillospiraceae bacterium]